MNRLTTALLLALPASLLAQQPDTLRSAAPDSASGPVFQLGVVAVTAARRATPQERITAATMQAQERMDVSRALDLLPGITLTASGPRNESMISVRGFDLRQVPVYMDGIPVYVPYDGYVDLGRFTTFDLSAVDVSKGFSSVLYGPNSLGGAINLISRKPEKKFEVDGALGAIDANGYLGSINLGSRQRTFYVQGSLSFLHRDSWPMSADFQPMKNEDGGQRGNSFRTDGKVSFKAGWTPNARNEYVLGYINQQGAKGSPVYAGSDTLNALLKKPRFWQWPQWNKETLYFLSNTQVTATSNLRARLYYDIFTNAINSFDDATYSTQKKPYAFQSFYNDYTYGGGIEYGTTAVRRNQLKLALQYKRDVHRENNLGEPVRRFEDNTATVGLEDEYAVTDRITLIPGISYSNRANMEAQDYNSSTHALVPFPQAAASGAFNGQAGLFYRLSEKHRLGASVAHKTRFATIKDRYSYRMGTAIPNPGLKPETATNYEVNWRGRPADVLSLQGALYYSRITDAIMGISNVEPGRSQMQNAGQAEFMGAEAALEWKVRKNLLCSVNYTYIERNNLQNPDLHFTDVPNTKLFGFLSYRPVDRIRMTASAEHCSSRYSTSYGTKAAAFTVANAFVSGKLWKYASLELGVNNLFDTNYSLVEGWPEEGRSFNLILRFFNHD